MGDCALFYGLAEAMNRGSYLLPKMTRSQIEAAIAGPLRAFGASIDNDLLQALLNETEAAQQEACPYCNMPCGGPGNPPRSGAYPSV